MRASSNPRLGVMAFFGAAARGPVSKVSTGSPTNASCKQEVCVNLIVHPLKHCININLPVFTAAAQRAGVSIPNLTIFAQTMMMVGSIQPQVVVSEMDGAISELKKGAGPPERVRELEGILKTIKMIKLEK